VRYPTRADELITLIEDHGWHLTNTLDTPTYHYRNRTGSLVLDLMLTTPVVAREVSNWAVDKENPTGSNHEVILFQISILYPDTEYKTPKPHLNWHKTNGDVFTSTLQKLSTNNYPLWSSIYANPTVCQLNNWASLLQDIITTVETFIYLFIYFLINTCNLKVMANFIELNDRSQTLHWAPAGLCPSIGHELWGLKPQYLYAQSQPHIC
jgi:hypothetical protein